MSETNRETVFVVDDEQENVNVLLRTLHPVYEARGFTDAKAALEAAREKLPDAFITDYRMPGMNGVELLTELRRIDRNVAVIMTTAYTELDDVVYSQQVKLLYRVVPKPYQPKFVLDLVGEAIRERRFRRELALHR
jgi:two-component system, NtrC family, nitrogen regulation response regulator GlnG